jgi:hypothetical protein
VEKIILEIATGICGGINILFLLLTSIFLNDDRPSSTVPWASYKSFIPIFKLLLKLVIPILFIFDPEVIFKKGFLNFK